MFLELSSVTVLSLNCGLQSKVPFSTEELGLNPARVEEIRRLEEQTIILVLHVKGEEGKEGGRQGSQRMKKIIYKSKR